MSSSKDIEDAIRRANCAAPEALRRRLWEGAAGKLHPSAPSEQDHDRRAARRVRIWKIAAAAAIVLVVLAWWHTFGTASKVYALSDVPGIIRQARTVHVRTLTDDGTGRWEHWYDIEHAREYVYDEGVYQVAFDSPETRKRATQTVRDGQYGMKVDHVERTVRFERWLPGEQELHRLMMADFALKTVLPNVLRHLDRYTKIGKGKIDGQSYDIWRREWKEFTGIGRRYDIWVCPSTGEIGLTRQWAYYNEPERGWRLHSETGKIEINQKPPANIFATEPPEGYLLENTKATADLTSAGFRPHQTPEKYKLTVPMSFVLADGSVLACWNVAGEPTDSDPNKPYRDLVWGGPVPDTSLTLYGLLSNPVLGTEERYGSVSFWDEDMPKTFVDGVGRHLTCTHRAGRVYEWALYVPQEELPSPESKETALVAVKWHARSLRSSPTIFELDMLTSLVVSPERLASYLADAFRELSDDTTVPSYMSYQNLLNLAKQTRENRGLYEDFAKEVKEFEKSSIDTSTVEVTPGTKPQ